MSTNPGNLRFVLIGSEGVDVIVLFYIIKWSTTHPDALIYDRMKYERYDINCINLNEIQTIVSQSVNTRFDLMVALNSQRIRFFGLS